MPNSLDSLIQQTQNQDPKALAQLLTLLESEGLSVLSQPALLAPPKKSFRWGITGPPGSGKSTLVGGLFTEWQKQNLSIGVLAIDPTSPVSQGAILGDRIRYQEQATDQKVFVRSLGTRGSTGGLSAAAYLMLRAYDLFGFDRVIIETVGVGQTELDVVGVADLTSVVLTPQSGDSIQAMKSGLIEVAHHFIINKADEPGAEILKKELEATLSLRNALSQDLNGPEKTQKIQEKILLTVATQGKGVAELAQQIEDFRSKFDWENSREKAQILQKEALALIAQKVFSRWEDQTSHITNAQDFKKFLESFLKT